MGPLEPEAEVEVEAEVAAVPVVVEAAVVLALLGGVVVQEIEVDASEILFAAVRMSEILQEGQTELLHRVEMGAIMAVLPARLGSALVVVLDVEVQGELAVGTDYQEIMVLLPMDVVEADVLLALVVLQDWLYKAMEVAQL